MITDPHDPREFRRYVQLSPDGTVASVHDYAASVEAPLPTAIEVTDLAPTDFGTLAIDPQLVTDLQASISDLGKKEHDLAVAQTALETSRGGLRQSQGAARAALSLQAAKAATSNGG